MSKRGRQGAILEIIRRHHVTSQEALRELGARQDIDVTQATLSRDIRDLRLVKVPGASGASHYTLPLFGLPLSGGPRALPEPPSDEGVARAVRELIEASTGI